MECGHDRVSAIVEHLESEGFETGWGSLDEIVIDFLTGELSGGRMSVEYISMRFRVTEAHAYRMVSEIKKKMEA